MKILSNYAISNKNVSYLNNPQNRMTKPNKIQSYQADYVTFTSENKELTDEQIEAFLTDAEIGFEKDKKTGLYILDKYETFSKPFLNAIEKHKLDENELFNHIIEIRDYGYFGYSNATSLGKVQKVGTLTISASELKDPGDLRYLGELKLFHDQQSFADILKRRGCKFEISYND